MLIKNVYRIIWIDVDKTNWPTTTTTTTARKKEKKTKNENAKEIDIKSIPSATWGWLILLNGIVLNNTVYNHIWLILIHSFIYRSQYELKTRPQQYYMKGLLVELSFYFYFVLYIENLLFLIQAISIFIYNCLFNDLLFIGFYSIVKALYKHSWRTNA